MGIVVALVIGGLFIGALVWSVATGRRPAIAADELDPMFVVGISVAGVSAALTAAMGPAAIGLLVLGIVLMAIGGRRMRRGHR